MSYLKYHQRHLHYQSPSDYTSVSPVEQYDFADSSYCAPTCRSGRLHTLQFTCRGKAYTHVLDFGSKKQRYCSLSSGHSEVMAMSLACRNSMVLNENLRLVFGISTCPHLLCDSAVAVAAVRRGFSRNLFSASRQVAIAITWLHQNVVDASFFLHFVDGSNNPSDRFTKGTPNESLDRLMSQWSDTKESVQPGHRSEILADLKVQMQPLFGESTLPCYLCGEFSGKLCHKCKQCPKCGCSCSSMN
jgi:hypothetical protein